MDKLQVTSKRLQVAVLVMIIFTPFAIAFTAVSGQWAALLNLPQGISIDASRIQGAGLMAVLAVGSIKPVAYIAAFRFLFKLLGLYREGIIFTADNVAAIRKIGWALVSIDIAGMIQMLLTGPVLTIFDISRRHISVRLEVAFLVVGLFVVLIANVMDLGRELKEQDRLVI